VMALPKITFVKKPSKNCFTERQHRECFPWCSKIWVMNSVDFIHSNFVGPLPILLLSKSKYFVVFTNDYSWKNWIYFLQSKTKTFTKFKMFKQLQLKEKRIAKSKQWRLIKEVNLHQ
jgi:hypothetical protein